MALPLPMHANAQGSKTSRLVAAPHSLQVAVRLIKNGISGTPRLFVAAGRDGNLDPPPSATGEAAGHVLLLILPPDRRATHRSLGAWPLEQAVTAAAPRAVGASGSEPPAASSPSAQAPAASSADPAAPVFTTRLEHMDTVRGPDDAA